MEELQTSEQLSSEEQFVEELKSRDNVESLKISLKECCIICGRRVLVIGNYDDNDHRRKEDLPEVAPEKVVKSPGFLRTFNGIWAILKKKRDGEIYCASGDDEDEVSLETVITGGLGSKAVFLEAPAFCLRCCDKVVAVENLMKAVRHQVREIKMLLEKSGNERERIGHNFEREFQCQPEDCTADIDVKDEEKFAGSQVHERPVSLSFDPELSNLRKNTTAKTGPEGSKEDGMEMECDEDLPNSLGDDDEDALMDDGEEDGSLTWNDHDPDYIKSEQDDDSNDDDEELTSEEELDEEPLTLQENQNDPSIPNDPLEIPSSSFRNPSPQKVSNALGSSPGPSSNQISCDEKGCSRKFSSASALYRHKKSCHSPPSVWEFGKATKGNFSSTSSQEIFTCGLAGCTRSFPNKDSLYKHKKSQHIELMIELEKLDPQNKHICSCGRRFPTHVKLYRHQSRNKTTHPDFEFKLRETRSLMVGAQLCDFCGEPVKSANILEHLAGHVGAEYVVKCPNFKECGHAFTHSKDLLDKHLNPKRFGNCRKMCEAIKLGFKCETCGWTADLRIKLAAHVDNEHERGTLPKNLKCPISGCGKMFATKQSVFLHLHAHRYRRITTQNCDKCGKDIKIEEMEGHLKDQHGIEEMFGCMQCPLKFPGRDEMVEHLYEHRHAGLSCDICPRDDKSVKYLQYFDFREHYLKEHQLCPKKYKCGECENKWFWRKNEVSQHKWLCHREQEAASVDIKRKKTEYKCEICDVSLKTNINLVSHKIRVHGADPYTCDICGETFVIKTKCNKHVKEHAGMSFQKEWKCEVEGCGRTFKNKMTWKRHVESGHGGEKRFVCEDCGKGFAVAGCLKTHRESVHLGLRPCVCNECGEAFKHGSTLRRHKLIHSGERPFVCDICGQRFRQKEVLGRHLKSHEKKGEEFKPSGPMKQIRKRKGQ